MLNRQVTKRKPKHSSISEQDKKYFTDIFNLNAIKSADGQDLAVRRIDKGGLADIFNMVGFEPNEK